MTQKTQHCKMQMQVITIKKWHLKLVFKIHSNKKNGI